MFAGLNYFLYVFSKRRQSDVNKALSLRTINYRLLEVIKYSSEAQEELPSAHYINKSKDDTNSTSKFSTTIHKQIKPEGNM